MFWLIELALQILLWAVPVLILLKLLLPGNKYVMLANRYLDIALRPISSLMRRYLPGLSQTGFDFSPIGLWLVIRILLFFVQLLWKILL